MFIKRVLIAVTTDSRESVNLIRESSFLQYPVSLKGKERNLFANHVVNAINDISTSMNKLQDTCFLCNLSLLQ